MARGDRKVAKHMLLPIIRASIFDGPLLINSFSPRDYVRLGGGLLTAVGGLIGLVQGIWRLRKSISA